MSELELPRHLIELRLDCWYITEEKFLNENVDSMIKLNWTRSEVSFVNLSWWPGRRRRGHEVTWNWHSQKAVRHRRSSPEFILSHVSTNGISFCFVSNKRARERGRYSQTRTQAFSAFSLNFERETWAMMYFNDFGRAVQFLVQLSLSLSPFQLAESYKEHFSYLRYKS